MFPVCSWGGWGCPELSIHTGRRGLTIRVSDKCNRRIKHPSAVPAIFAARHFLVTSAAAAGVCCWPSLLLAVWPTMQRCSLHTVQHKVRIATAPPTGDYECIQTCHCRQTTGRGKSIYYSRRTFTAAWSQYVVFGDSC